MDFFTKARKTISKNHAIANAKRSSKKNEARLSGIIEKAKRDNLNNGAPNNPRSTIRVAPKSDTDLIIDLMGYTGIGTLTGTFDIELQSIAHILGIADVSFTSIRRGPNSSKQYYDVVKHFKGYRLFNVSRMNPYITSTIIDTTLGNVAIIDLNMFALNRREIDDVLYCDIMREALALKSMGAETIITYVDLPIVKDIKDEEIELERTLLELGIDYVVGVSPYTIKSGISIMHDDRSIGHSIVSMGTFLSEALRLPKERIMLMLRLRRINGRLQVIQESFYPLKLIVKKIPVNGLGSVSNDVQEPEFEPGEGIDFEADNTPTDDSAEHDYDSNSDIDDGFNQEFDLGSDEAASVNATTETSEDPDNNNKPDELDSFMDNGSENDSEETEEDEETNYIRVKDGFDVLIENEADNDSNRLKSLGRLERKMARIHRADRLLTVGMVIDGIGRSIPPQYDWIRDFSVRQVVARVVDSRPDDVYFSWQPYTDPNDAETYEDRLQTALESGSKVGKRALFMVAFHEMESEVPYIVVEDTLAAHIAINKQLRQQHSVKTIGITGSVGKTSTKEMLYQVLKMQYQTKRSLHNQNTHTRIGRLMQSISSDTEIFIQEIGGGRPGGALRHGSMVLPEATVVTNIGDAHLGNFYGDKTALMENKLQIADSMVDGGILYLNGDDPLLVTAKTEHKVIYYGVDNKTADYYADNIAIENGQTVFDIVHGDSRVRATLDVPGKHNVLNAVCCYAIGQQFGIPDDLIVEGLKNFKTSGIRQSINHKCGYTFFMDCFNASSGSMEASLSMLLLIPVDEGNKRIAVVGDVTGLGDMSEKIHNEIASTCIANAPDLFIFFGDRMRPVYERVIANNKQALYADSYDNLVALLKASAAPGDIIGAKGSSKMKLDSAIDEAFGTRFNDPSSLAEKNYYRRHALNVVYNMFATHATACRLDKTATGVFVRASMEGLPVRNIASNFGDRHLCTAHLPNSIHHIGDKAFLNCRRLSKVNIPKDAKYIGDEAFKNCSALPTMKLPDGLLHIGDEAFYGCYSLNELKIPESVRHIGNKAFERCPFLQIKCREGSYADMCLTERNIRHTYY